MARASRWLSPWVLALLFTVSLIACSGTQNGGAEEPTDEGLSHESGDTTDDPLTADPVTEPEPEPEPEPTASGPGELRLEVTAGGEPAMGKLRILTAEVEPELVMETESSKTVELPSGDYDVEVTNTSLLDRPEKRLRDVPVKAGELTERELDFPVGTIILNPRRGRGTIRSEVHWRYAGGGDWFEETSRTGEELTLSTGRYDAQIKIGRTEVVINDIQVYEGRRTLSPAVQMGGR